MLKELHGRAPLARRRAGSIPVNARQQCLALQLVKKRFFDLVVTLDTTRECRWKYIGREFESHLFSLWLNSSSVGRAMIFQKYLVARLCFEKQGCHFAA